jgi:hypothetical protein
MDINRIAMWSGPRNISTALMRSFENRPDTWVVDEPFYGFYLQNTQYDHPGRADIIAAMTSDWRRVAEELVSAPADVSRRVHYQKHMTHHLLSEVDLSFIGSLNNVFLIRNPALIIESYAKVRPDFDIVELGFLQQWSIYQYCLTHGQRPPIILDSQQVLAAPEQTLKALCQALGLNFFPAMLQWPKGARASDGVWAKYWYDSVENSTGFNTGYERQAVVPTRYSAIHAQAYEIYQNMLASEHLLKVAPQLVSALEC